MDNLGGLIVDHVDAQLTFHDTWQEPLVNELAVLTLDILLTEFHEVVYSSFLTVIVHGFLQMQQRIAID